MPVRVVVESVGDAMLLRPTGRLDLASTGDLRGHLWKAVAQQPAGIVVDLSGLTVDGDVPLTIFLSFARYAGQPSGCPVVLCAPPATLRAGLARLGVNRAVPVCPTLRDALTAAGSTPASDRYRRLLHASPAAAALARRVVAEACRAWNLPGVVEDAQIVATELVANAVLHASRRHATDGRVGQVVPARVGVGPQPPRRRQSVAAYSRRAGTRARRGAGGGLG